MPPPPGASGPRPRTALLLLGLYWLALLPLFVAWLHVDRQYAPWDQAMHASMALRLHDGVVAGNPWRFYELSKFYPPLFHLLAMPVAFVTHHPDAFSAGNWLALLGLLGGVYVLGRALAGSAAGLAAALLVPAFPYVTFMARMPMTDLTVAALVAWTLALLCAPDPLATASRVRRVGLVLALGLLAKWSFLFFTALPLLAVLVRHAPRARATGAALGSTIAWLALWPALLAGPWYVRSAGDVVAQLGWQLGAGVQHDEGDPSPLSLASLLYYPPVLRDAYLTPPVALAVFAGGVAVALAWWRRGACGTEIAAPARWLPLLLSLLGGVASLLLIANKDPRYPLPLVPPLAVLAGTAITLLRPSRRTIALAVCAIAGWILAWHALFRLVPPEPTDWRVEEVGAQIANGVAVDASDAPVRVLVVPNDLRMNFASLRHAIDVALRVRAVTDRRGRPRKVEVDQVRGALDAPALATYDRVVLVWPPPDETVVSRGTVDAARALVADPAWMTEVVIPRDDGREIRVLEPVAAPSKP